MKAYLNVYWDQMIDGRYGAFLQFETPEGERLEGVPVEDVLPPECRDQARDPKEARDFFQALSHWLISDAHIRQQLRKAKGHSRENPLHIAPPPVDLAHFGMLDAAGVVDAARVRAVVALIARFWAEPPQPGLLDRLFAHTQDLQLIEARLVALYRFRDLPQDAEQLKLAKALLPPECREGGSIIADGQIEIALRWLKRNSGGALKQDALLWSLNLRELGLVTPDGRLNEDAARAASEFIWARRDQAPDFGTLKEHLAGFRAAPAPSQAETHRQAEQTAAARKIAKARKQAKLNRKRGRRR